MSEQESRCDRVARYKEERRKQLAEQFSHYQATVRSTRARVVVSGAGKDGNSSSNSEGPRATRTSKLRAAAAASQENLSSQIQTNKSSSLEKPQTNETIDNEMKVVGSKRIERDKSNKRKSNLNRSLNSEEVPSTEYSAGDLKDRRRRRRFFPAELFDATPSSLNDGDDKERSYATATASPTSPSVTSDTATSSSYFSSKLTSTKASDLSVHMENARRSVTSSSSSDMGKNKIYSKRLNNSSPKSSTSKLNEGRLQSSSLPKFSSRVSYHRTAASDDEKTKAIASRMEGLSALTKQTLARVERLTNKNKDLTNNHDAKNSNKPSTKPTTEKSLISSILKKKFEETTSLIIDHSSLLSTTPTVGPVSILKRKVSQDDNRLEGNSHSSNQTPPVTFSPSVLEPSTTRRKQGILKKRRSLDESTVLRHRSCSPDVSNKSDSRSILKNQRRSSLEELWRTRSPDTPKQGILKRRSSKYDDDDHSLNSPQGILKRKSGASSAGSTGNSPHISITTAVILAAAGGAEMVLDSDGETVRPILKKKSFSEEYSHHIDTPVDTPKPILKKKSSTDTDDSEEKPRPILKLPKPDTYEIIDSKTEVESEMKPILKQTTSREELPRPRLSFSNTNRDQIREQTSRRSHTICSDFNIDSLISEDRERDRPRPFSVYDLVMSFEQTCSTGAIPKRNYKRNSERQKTQPITINELEASRNLVKSQARIERDHARNQNNFSSIDDVHSQLDFGSSLKTDDHQNSLFSPLHNKNSADTVPCGKMSSDSAFQSLGEGLELEQDKEQSPVFEQKHGKSESSKELPKIKSTCVDDNTTKIKVKDTERVYEVKSIVRSFSDASTRSVPSSPRSVLKKYININMESRQNSVLKNETFLDKDDEGISCDDSDSESDDDASANTDNVESKASKNRREVDGDSISEGESSGGREVAKIFQSEKVTVTKQVSQVSMLNKEEFNNTVNIFHASNQSIADVRAKLQERGESDWRKRISQNNSANDELKFLKEKNKYNDELSEKSLLLAKKDELDAASKQWKSRVEKSDAEKFSVAGKLIEKRKDDIPTINIPSTGNSSKKTPVGKRFKLKEGSDTALTTSPLTDISRSLSFKFKDSNIASNIYKKSVPVLNPDDISLRLFFKTSEHIESSEQVEVSLEDFDAIPRQSLLVIKKNVTVQKRREASKNPIKALAIRNDICNEYTEITTGVAEREKKRLNIENLSKNSNKAVEALAGLASEEDFKSVALKKSLGPRGQVPWKDVMLLQVKGRRHVQTRLVEPTANSINEGDCYMLITSNALYTYTGAYSNIIEQSRMSDIINHIQKTGDLGCKVNSAIAVNKDSNSAQEFWRILGEETLPNVIDAGHPDEDETYETNILHTNMIYTLENDELIPYEKYWGSLPNFEMLNETNILVFDFGSEMYVWSGKNAPFNKKSLILKLAKKMWDDGYNYSECDVCPLNIASLLGARSEKNLPLQAQMRPDWALFAKLTQHRETILFKEKFFNWPDFNRLIRIKNDENLNKNNVPLSIEPCDVIEMIKGKNKNPDLVAENVHMGRGDQYYDKETNRLFMFETLKLTGWLVSEYSYELLPEKLLGQLYDGNSYIFRWDFRQTVKGRELSGNPSKHASVGRDRCIFFCWQGNNSSINEKGTAALLTVELDKQNAPQIRLTQGSEPAAFLQLFNGNLIINKGKQDSSKNKTSLYILRGERENEIYLMEVSLAMSSLRSRSSFMLVDIQNKEIFIWHGIKSTSVLRKSIKIAVDNFTKNNCCSEECKNFKTSEIVEGSETEDFLHLLGDKENYCSLLNSNGTHDQTTRLFRMSSITGRFLAIEILCPHRSEHFSPYPFVQSDIYTSTQPALFLIDNHDELWLWQGYFPENITEGDTFDQTGSGAIRWQAERKAAMQTAVAYWKEKYGDKPLVAYLVWAGLEPVEFINIFPSWEIKPDITDIYKKEGKVEGTKVVLSEELALLSRTTFPLYELLRKPLPVGVDPTNLEKYLSNDDFQTLFTVTKEEFDRLPSWKKTALKKEKGLF